MSYSKDEPIGYEVLELIPAAQPPTDGEKLARATHRAITQASISIEPDDKFYWEGAIPGWVLIPSAARLAELGYVNDFDSCTYSVGHTYGGDDGES